MKTHFITGEHGRVSCSCSDNSNDTFTFLLGLGYQPSVTYSEMDPYIFTAGNLIYSSNNQYIENVEEGTYDSLYGVWCGNDIEMFKSIAALDDRTDKHQYFILDTELWSPEGSNVYKKGSFIKCKRDKWNVDVLEDGTPCPFSSRNIPAHKADVIELLNYFSNKGNVSNVNIIHL